MKNTLIIVISILLTGGAILGYIERGKLADVHAQTAASDLAGVAWVAESLWRVEERPLALKMLKQFDEALAQWQRGADKERRQHVQALRADIAAAYNDLLTTQDAVPLGLSRLRTSSQETARLLRIIPVTYRPSMEMVNAAVSHVQREFKERNEAEAKRNQEREAEAHLRQRAELWKGVIGPEVRAAAQADLDKAAEEADARILAR